MQSQSAPNPGIARPAWCRACVNLGMFSVALLTCAAAVADPVPQFGVTAVNANGNSLYNVTLTPNAMANTGALITSTTQLDTDASTHGNFFAVVRSPNSVTSALDLIVADATKFQIVRYAGPGPTYQPASTIFNYSGKGSGPSITTGLAVDVAGNLYAASAGIPFISKPALWALPFNATTGAYGAPILIDNIFSGLLNVSLAEVVVANAAANPVGNAAPAWNQGDVLVLIDSCIGGARVLVYSQAAIAGVLSNPSVPLTGPTSVVIPPSLFGGERPTGIDLWPADASYPSSGHGVSLLLPTTDGRVMRFDSSTGAFVQDFADGLGNGLRKIKVGVYSTFPYAFLAQTQPGSGRILQFGAPPSSGANSPLASVSTGVNNPEGLAVTNSASVPVSNCIAPNTCAPLGAQLTTQIAATNLNPNNPVLEQSCVINADPRVTASVSAGTWSCAGGTIDVANFCPGFPSTLVPASLCGHSGPTGSGFVVVETTAIAVDEDPNINNSFIQYTIDATLPLPGALDLICPQVPIFAWAPRSDLPLIEGTIPEGNTFIDLSGFCDNGGGHSHVASMIAYGLAVNNSPIGLPQGLPGFVDNKFANLTQTITNAGTQINDGGTTQGYVTQAQAYFDAGVKNTDPNSYACAMNTIATVDAYVRGNPANFSGLAPPGNRNPAGDIDARLANLFLTIDVDFLVQAPNTQWTTTNVPPCMTFTVTPTTVTLPGGSAQLTWSSGNGPYPASSCVLSASDGSFTTQMTFTGASGSVSTGALKNLGTYSAQLICSTASSTITGFAQATINVIQLASINVAPAAPPPQVVAGASVQLTATGIYSDQSTQNVTGSVNWMSSDTSSAIVSGGLVTCISTASTPKQVVISAVGATATGSVPVTCLAPTLSSVAVAPQNSTVAAGATVQLSATANYSYGSPQIITSAASWVSSNTNVATVAGGLVTCVAGSVNAATITAASGGLSGSTTVNCQAPVLQSVSVAPLTPTVAAGSTVQLTATANYSYGSSQNVTGTATWSSSNTNAATVSGGLVMCVAGVTNAATITATSGGVSGSTTVNCQAPVLESITVTPQSPPEIGNGGTLQLKATGTYSFGPAQNVTSVATWTSSAPTVATVSTTGLVSCKHSTSKTKGKVTISASIGATSGSTYVTCGCSGD